MTTLDLDPDRKTLRRVAQRPKVQDDSVDLHENVALLNGVPPYGYFLYWDSAWSQPQVYLFAITAKKVIRGSGVYYLAHYVKDVTPRRKGEQEGFVLNRLKGAAGKKPQRSYRCSTLCNGETHEINHTELAFTPASLAKLFERTQERHLRVIRRESEQLLQKMAELGTQAARLEASRNEVLDYTLGTLSVTPAK